MSYKKSANNVRLNVLSLQCPATNNDLLHQPVYTLYLTASVHFQERQKTTGGRGTQQKKGGKSIILSDSEQRSLPSASLRFPVPPPPVMNANLPRGLFYFYVCKKA